MAEILLVSKPVAPPWNDSSKNLVRDLAHALRRHHPVVLGRRQAPVELPRGRLEPLYPHRSGGFAPGLRDNARVLGRLIGGRPAALWHFFFAPNPRSSQAGRLAARLRGVPTVHTVCSAPDGEADLRRVLFADRTVVLSRHTEQRLLDAGIDEASVRRVPPAIEPLEPLDPEQRRQARERLGLPVGEPLVLYPGDLEFGSGATVALQAFARLAERSGVHLVMACRAKTPGAREVEQTLRMQSEELKVADRVHWVGEIDTIHALIGSVDVVLLPSETLYAKMDYPLVLLEAMSLARPVIVARGTPAAELADEGGALAVEPSTEAVAATISAWLDDDERRARAGAEARRVVLERYTREPMAAAYEQLYDELLGERPPRRGSG